MQILVETARLRLVRGILPESDILLSGVPMPASLDRITMIIYKKDYINIAYYEAEKLLEVSWLAYASSAAYREAMLQYIEALRKYEVKRWLEDLRQARVVRLSDQTWTKEEWAPLFFQEVKHLEKIARVRSTDISARISSENMFRALDYSHVQYGLMEFEFYGEARNWLLA